MKPSFEITLLPNKVTHRWLASQLMAYRALRQAQDEFVPLGGDKFDNLFKAPKEHVIIPLFQGLGNRLSHKTQQLLPQVNQLMVYVRLAYANMGVSTLKLMPLDRFRMLVNSAMTEPTFSHRQLVFSRHHIPFDASTPPIPSIYLVGGGNSPPMPISYIEFAYRRREDVVKAGVNDWYWTATLYFSERRTSVTLRHPHGNLKSTNTQEYQENYLSKLYTPPKKGSFEAKIQNRQNHSAAGGADCLPHDIAKLEAYALTRPLTDMQQQTLDRWKALIEAVPTNNIFPPQEYLDNFWKETEKDLGLVST